VKSTPLLTCELRNARPRSTHHRYARITLDKIRSGKIGAPAVARKVIDDFKSADTPSTPVREVSGGTAGATQGFVFITFARDRREWNKAGLGNDFHGPAPLCPVQRFPGGS